MFDTSSNSNLYTSLRSIIMQCDFEDTEIGIKCKCCGYTLKGVHKSVKKTCKEECGQYPSLFQMALNFTSSMVKYTLDGFQNVDDEEQKRRKSICESCPLNLYVKEDERCLSCGCSLPLATRIRSYDCPKGFWNKE